MTSSTNSDENVRNLTPKLAQSAQNGSINRRTYAQNKLFLNYLKFLHVHFFLVHT